MSGDQLAAAEARTREVLLMGFGAMAAFVFIGVLCVAPAISAADRWLAKGVKARVQTQLRHSRKTK